MQFEVRSGKKKEIGLDPIVTFSEMIHFFLLHSWKHMERSEGFTEEGSVGSNLLELINCEFQTSSSEDRA